MPSIWASLPALLLLPTAITGITFDCKNIRVDKQDFNLGALGGVKTVNWQEATPPTIKNTTFTIDICSPLKKGKPAEEFCPNGARVCGIERRYHPDGSVSLDAVMPIAGEFSGSHGRAMEPRVTRLKDGESHEDSEREGLRVELNGGKYPDTSSGRAQKAVIEFLCDKEKEGTEGFESSSLEFGAMGKRADDKEDDGDGDEDKLPDLDKGKALQFKSYKPEGKSDTGVLRLTWKTKYACEGQADKAPDNSKGGSSTASWGFFTWLIIIVFLFAAAYIIFGSWLNYNRYGARGWDLIPHGDTIRDMPYIVKDFGSNVVDRMKGSDGSRGGYAAV